MGITAGYHRLWSHKTYSACFPVRILLALLGAGVAELSIQRWSRDHRAHHRYVDTDRDPYNVHKGILHAHIGWIIFKQDHLKIGKADISDLDADPIVAWQHHYYDRLLIIMAFIVPSLVSGIGWGDWNGGFVYAGCLRMFVVQQSTFCINSLGHWLGDQPYQTDKSPKNNLIVAFLTLGEGYHNFHHEFPNDYRNGINHSDFDPTKWFIYTMTLFGLAYDLKRFPSNEIQKGYHQQCQKSLQIKSAQIDWGTPEEELPLMKRNDFTDAKRSLLTCIDGIVYDITGFAHEHPGGQIILSWVGKDASEAFNGGIYQHSNAAHNLLSQMRIARLEA